MATPKARPHETEGERERGKRRGERERDVKEGEEVEEIFVDWALLTL